MSHSRIFQFSDKKIKKEDYLTDNEMCTNDYLWHKFEGSFCGDYTNEHHGDIRIEDIKWLAASLKSLDIALKEKDVFVLGETFKEKINAFWYSRIHKAFNELNKDKMEFFPSIFGLKYSCIDPLSMGFGFLFYSGDTGLTQSDEFFEWLLAKNPGDLIYIGATLDYHC